MNTENNKIIADFMGYKIESNEVYPLLYLIHEDWFAVDELQFNHNWNWLMEVVEKINQINNQRFTVLINSMDCKVFDNLKNKTISDSFGRFTPDQLKESIYNCCLDFIKWYYQQK